MEASKSAVRRMKGAVGGKVKEGAASPPETPKVYTLTRDPQLCQYILTRALKRPDGVSFTDLARTLMDAKDKAGDKTARNQLAAIFLQLSFYEELPPDVITLLLPLFQTHAKDPRSLRSLLYLSGVFAGPGAAGTPTLIDPSLSGRRPDEKSLGALMLLCRALLEQPNADAANRRAAFFLLSAAARCNEEAKKELVSQAQRAVVAADALASAMGSVQAAASKRRLGPAPLTAQNNWDLQHSVFATIRLAGAATGGDELSRTFVVGVGSPDPVGARHALALAADVALRDASTVMREMSHLVHDTADAYEAGLVVPPNRLPGQGINIEDPFARLHLARCCAHVVHSDQSSSDIGRDGQPFWRMLCMLATRDEVDMVRFGAMETLTGSVPSTSLTTPSSGRIKPAGMIRDDAVQQQRRSRAWRLLVAQGGTAVTIPSIAESTSMKLIDVMGRLLVLALRKVESTARFTVAVNIVASLAESSLASQSISTSRASANPEIDRIMNILASELDTLIESPLPAALRSVCIQALLMMQAAGYRTSLTPAKLAQLGGTGKGSRAGVGVQDALLAAVLKCARLKHREASSFLGYASGVVGMAPAGLDLTKVTELWDATAAAGKEGKEAALSAAMWALTSPAPPCTRPGTDAKDEEVIQAAKEEDGWNAFLASALWWLGEHANELSGEFVGRKSDQAFSKTNKNKKQPNGADGTAAIGGGNEDVTPAGVLRQHAARNPALGETISTLHSLALTGPWLLRVASARALATIAMRSGEPYRLQCYGILAACAGVGRDADALGVQGVVGPVLALLDAVYASQAALNKLWEQYGDDVDDWPTGVITSLARRNAELVLRCERLVCALPKDKYSILGVKAVQVLASASEDTGAYSNFLGAEESSKVSERAGGDLGTVKNREVEDILSFGGEVETDSFKFSTVGDSMVMGDKDKEIENMLSAGAGVLDNPWTAQASSYSSFNAFAEAPAPTSTAYDSYGGGATTGGAGPGIWATAPSTTAPTQTEPIATSTSPWGAAEQAPAPPADAAGTARVLGVGTMLHTFVADPHNPEEISVFGGDKVEVLEESDGWMLVRDPTGLQGLVPTSYVQLQQLYGDTSSGAGASGREAAVSPTVGGEGSRHKRFASIDYFSSKEDYLDRMFTGGDATSPTAGHSNPYLSSMPEDVPYSTTTGATGAGRAISPPPYGTAQSTSPPPYNQQLGGTGSVPPVWRQGSGGSYASPTWRATGSPRTTSPSRMHPGTGSDLLRQVSLGGGGNPFNPVHRRQGSTASHNRTLSGGSHRRTLSGGSGASGEGAWGSPSMPGTPSQVDGPERPIIAGFAAEMEGELSVDPGDKVKVHSETGGWARVIRVADRKVGLVPAWAVGGE